MVMVKEIMCKKVVSSGPETDVKKLCQLMIKGKVTGLPIVDKEKQLIGYVSERDIVFAATKPNFYKKRARDIMIKRVYVVDEKTTLSEVSLVFTNKDYRHLPVTSKGKLVGMISRRDIINQMLGHYY